MFAHLNLIALDHAMPQFRERGVEVIGVSIDSHFTHNAWRNTSTDKGESGKYHTHWRATSPIASVVASVLNTRKRASLSVAHSSSTETALFARKSSMTYHWVETWRKKFYACLTLCSSTKSTAKYALLTGKKAKKVCRQLHKAWQVP